MLKRFLLSEYLVCWLCAAYFAVMIPLVPGWLSTWSLASRLSQGERQLVEIAKALSPRGSDSDP